MLNSDAPRLKAQWICIPGRMMPGQQWIVSAIPAIAVIADDCITLGELDRYIPGLLAMVKYWPEIVRLLEWKVSVTPNSSLDAKRRQYLPIAYADGWRKTPWTDLTVRCDATEQRRAAQVIHTRTSGLAKSLIGPEGLFRSSKAATLAPLRITEEPPELRFPKRIEVPAALGDLQFEKLAITPSPYRPERQAAAYQSMRQRFTNADGVLEPLGLAMLEALDRDGRGLSDAALDNIARNYFRGRVGLVQNFVPDVRTDPYHDYFGRTELPCDPWGQSTQEFRDFQEFWNGLLAYPTLARVFGVTNDLSVEGAATIITNNRLFSIAVKPYLPSRATLPAGVGSETRDLINSFATPWTACKAVALTLGTATRIVVVPRSMTSSEISGLLPLDGCHIESMNIDDAARKLRAVAESEVCKEHSTVLTAGSDANLPAPSTWGLALMHPSEQRFVLEAPARVANGDEELYSEHLTAGHRFDIRQDGIVGAPWTSLCARSVFYAGTPEGTPTIACPPLRDEAPDIWSDETALTPFEEGIVRSAGRKTAVKGDKRYLVGDELFVWQDWPLCVPEPSSDPITDERRLPYRQTVGYQSGHEVRLRFGESYSVAGRLAYLNGDGLTLEEAAEFRKQFTGQTPVLTVLGRFERLEPLRPPEVHVGESIDETDTPGDQIDVVVVRSGPDVPSHQGKSHRYVIPPRVSAHFANYHADAFDRIEGGDEPPAGSLKHVHLACSGDVPTVAEVRAAFGNKYVRKDPTPQHRNDTMVVFDDKFKDDVVEDYYVDPAVRLCPRRHRRVLDQLLGRSDPEP